VYSDQENSSFSPLGPSPFLSKIYNAFHTDVFHHYIKSPILFSQWKHIPPPLALVDRNDEYEVQEDQFLVNWKDYGRGAQA
jgi:hypothetical protein